MDMIEEKKRLEELVQSGMFQEIDTGKLWTVTGVSHNIYKDVVIKLYDGAKVLELIEGSEEYYKKFKRLN